ncbi:unnamed protein product [Cuscuta campestris]|uniref:Uncharacterized protein n=1 Tax=Cuscuta campestris TaxID=132261 RepID=A0A484M2K6_9ASTE|nr:unnamed protein product [Cuscuta campestris]
MTDLTSSSSDQVKGEPEKVGLIRLHDSQQSLKSSMSACIGMIGCPRVLSLPAQNVYHKQRSVKFFMCKHTSVNSFFDAFLSFAGGKTFSRFRLGRVVGT